MHLFSCYQRPGLPDSDKHPWQHHLVENGRRGLRKPTCASLPTPFARLLSISNIQGKTPKPTRGRTPMMSIFPSPSLRDGTAIDALIGRYSTTAKALRKCFHTQSRRPQNPPKLFSALKAQSTTAALCPCDGCRSAHSEVQITHMLVGSDGLDVRAIGSGNVPESSSFLCPHRDCRPIKAVQMRSPVAVLLEAWPSMLHGRETGWDTRQFLSRSSWLELTKGAKQTSGPSATLGLRKVGLTPNLRFWWRAALSRRAPGPDRVRALPPCPEASSAGKNRLAHALREGWRASCWGAF